MKHQTFCMLNIDLEHSHPYLLYAQHCSRTFSSKPPINNEDSCSWDDNSSCAALTQHTHYPLEVDLPVFTHMMLRPMDINMIKYA